MKLLTALQVTQRLRCVLLTAHYSTTKSINKLLIANRGEIACRIIRTARKMGIKTVAIYSDIDETSLHATMADQSFLVGPAPSAKSYLNRDRILSVCKEAGVNAVHPGYGFLSENYEFAEQLTANGIVWVGPPPSAIKDMGVKSRAKEIMQAAKVPVVPGYHGVDQSDQLLHTEADRIGYPVLIKATHGGGGKGMRIVEKSSDFLENLQSCRRESQQAFANADVILEKYIAAPRHVEVQVFGDQHQNAVYLWERDCSVQRRHQKVLEESPAPGLADAERKWLGETAVRAAKAVGYVGAGTVEFLMDVDARKFYFMEMNTRLQVEHPVTEMVTGLDLVQWQLLVAQGHRLPLLQESIQRRGHAIEARIYAESAARNFMPSPGPLLHLRTPVRANADPDEAAGAQLRVDTGVRSGDTVSIYYDPMIAKLIAWGADRPSALRRLDAALAAFHVVGTENNVPFLRQLCQNESFASGNLTTALIGKSSDSLLSYTRLDGAQLLGASAARQVRQSYLVTRLLCAACLARQLLLRPRGGADPWATLSGFRVNLAAAASAAADFQLAAYAANVHNVRVDVLADHNALPQRTGASYAVQLALAGSTDAAVRHLFSAVQLNADPSGANRFHLVASDVNHNENLNFDVYWSPDSQILDLFHSTSELPVNHVSVTERQPSYLDTSTDESHGKLLISPMPGVVNQVLVKEGQQVSAGESLVVIVAMKMEYIIRASREATVRKVRCSAGDNVDKGQELVELD